MSAALLTGCGGPGSHPALTAPPAANAAPGPVVTASLAFKIPARTMVAATARKPAFIPSTAAQITVNATNTVPSTQTTSLALASSCTSQPDGSQACSVPVKSPVGSVTFVIHVSDASSHQIASGTNSTPATIAEGAANTVPFIILRGQPATMTASVAAIPIASTTGVPVTLKFTDASGATITGADPLGDTNGAPVTLTTSTLSTANGSYSASSTCAPSASSFPNWTPSSTLYYCPTSAATLGTVEKAALSSGPFVAFNAPRALFPAGTVATWHTNGSLTGVYMTSISGNDTDSVFGIGYTVNSQFQHIAEASYSTAIAWPPISYSFDLYPVYQTPASGYLMASWIDQNNGPGRWAFSPTSYSGTENQIPAPSNVVAWATAPETIPHQVYAAMTDDSTTGNVVQMDWSSLSFIGTYSTLPAFPHSIAGSPETMVYIGFSNSATVGTLFTNAGSTNVINGPFQQNSIVDAGVTGTVVAGNQGTSFAIGYGAGQPLRIYALTPQQATKVATLSSASDQLPMGTIGSSGAVTNAGTAAVGTDGRLYFAVANGPTCRIVAWDPYAGVLVDPAINVSSLDATKPMVVSPGKNGTILVGGTLSGDTDVGVVQYP